MRPAQHRALGIHVHRRLHLGAAGEGPRHAVRDLAAMRRAARRRRRARHRLSGTQAAGRVFRDGDGGLRRGDPAHRTDLGAAHPRHERLERRPETEPARDDARDKDEPVLPRPLSDARDPRCTVETRIEPPRADLEEHRHGGQLGAVARGQHRQAQAAGIHARLLLRRRSGSVLRPLHSLPVSSRVRLPDGDEHPGVQLCRREGTFRRTDRRRDLPVPAVRAIPRQSVRDDILLHSHAVDDLVPARGPDHVAGKARRTAVAADGIGTHTASADSRRSAASTSASRRARSSG